MPRSWSNISRIVPSLQNFLSACEFWHLFVVSILLVLLKIFNSLSPSWFTLFIWFLTICVAANSLTASDNMLAVFHPRCCDLDSGTDLVLHHSPSLKFHFNKVAAFRFWPPFDNTLFMSFRHLLQFLYPISKTFYEWAAHSSNTQHWIGNEKNQHWFAFFCFLLLSFNLAGGGLWYHNSQTGNSTGVHVVGRHSRQWRNVSEIQLMKAALGLHVLRKAQTPRT